MNCQNCYSNGRTPSNPATLVVWCPTWITANNGPLNLCEECAKTFKPECNPFAQKGSFHWGDEAHTAFKSVELFLPHNDPRFANAKGMLKNKDASVACFSKIVVVDGKAWVMNSHLITRLGDYFAAKEAFPNLFIKD